ncbi:glycosyl hydrolase, BNR repeat [Opitutus terrae PB90-1]|uniref:Glycosyl hydrolase, BNR repeat n=2 Tax=Opitutus terrae TaxID=107709 RepID=B1ZMZ3_OPITP|nr:glycosyl hydrolase, BNR repeat [Opitutus terrae PB90-1]
MLVTMLWLTGLVPSAFAQRAPRILLLDAALADGHIVAVGESGSILRSADSGQSWITASSGARATLTGISFAPESGLGWAVGHDALILHTTDAGVSWAKQWQGEDLESSFLDVLAITNEHVIAVGAYGLYQFTQDGGRTWTQRAVLDEDMHLNRISRGPTGTLYLAGERGTLLRSRDQGETWVRIDSPYDGSFYGILPLGPETLLAYGLRGRVFRSTDDGETWIGVPLPQPMLLATAVKSSSGPIVLAGQARAHFVSRDDGATFSAWDIELTTAVAELFTSPDGTLFAFGEAGVSRLPAP